jgi:serine/threonine protein kinase
MDYLNHGSLLSQIIKNVGFGEDLGRLIFAQLLDGLEAIHNSNIVHLDIKLNNIILQEMIIL